MSDFDSKQPPSSAHRAVDPADGGSSGHAGGGPVLRTRMPKTTGDIARSRGAAPSPSPSDAVAGLPEGGASDLTDDAGAEPTDAGTVDTAPSAPPTPPPPGDDPFGLHLLGQVAGDGMPLPGALRNDLEAATGASLGDVTLHAGARGASTAAAHDARAVTLGREIFVGAGEFAPDESEGRQLLAHEVAHTVQQQVGPTEIAAKRTDPSGTDAISAAEIDADDFAKTFAAQGAATHWRPRATAAGPLRKPRDEETIDRDRLHFIKATKGTGPVNAAAYLQSAYKTLLREIGVFLLGRAITPGHPDLQFIAGSRDFLAKLGQLLDVGEGRDVIARLAECLAPANLYEITDRKRPITDDGESVADLVGAWAELPDDGDVYNDGPRGPRLWQPAVAIAVGSALEAQLAQSLPRMAAQYIAIAERNRQRAVAKGEMPEEVKATELVPGHPLDWYVARAFAEPPASVEPAGRKLDADPSAVVEYKKVTEVEWLGPPAPWNAVRAVQPPKASREAMAARLLGSPTEAHRLTKIGDYFVIPEDVAATFPEAARHRPRTRRKQEPTDAVHALGASALGDQAAAAEVDASEAKAPQRGELAALWTAIDERLQGLVLVTAKLPGHDLLLGAVAHHAATRAGLDVLGEEEATTRLAVYRSQLQILTEISQDIGALSTHIEQHAAQDPWADRVTAGQKARLTALLRAASLAHLAETGRAALAEARALEQTQVLDVLDGLFADAVGRIEGARHVRDDARLQTQRGEEVFGATLAQRRDLIAQEMADLRTKLRHGTAAPEAIQRLVGKIDGFRFEAMLVANFGAIEQVMNAAEQLEESDWVAAADQLDDLEEIRGAGNRFRMGLSQILGQWRAANRKAKTQLAWIESKGGDPDIEARVFALVDGTLAELRAKLAALGDDAGIQKFLQRAYDEIDDAQTKAAILQIATMIAVTIAISIASAGVGSIATGAAAGVVGEGLVATGVGIVVESASMSVMTTLVNGGDFGDVFVSDMAQNVVMITALRGFDAVFRATRIGQTVAHGASAGRLAYYSAKGVELTGRALVMSGVMYAGAQVESLRKQGRTLTTAEIEEQAVQGIAQVIGTAVLARLAKTPMAQLKALGARGGALAKQHVQLTALARQVKRTKDPAAALHLLRTERAQLEGELALWQDLSTKSPAELHRMGIEPELVAAMHGSASQHLTGLDMLEGGTLPAQLGLETVVPGRVFAGTQPKIDAVLDSYRKPGVTIETHAEADGSYRYRVVGPDGIPVDLIARPDATARPRPRGGDATRGASAATAASAGGAATVAPSAPAQARPVEQVRADIERAALRAAHMAGGVAVEGAGTLRLVDGGDGFPVRVEIADLGADGAPSKLTLADDHAVLTVSTRAQAAEVERVILHRLTEAAALTARRRAGKPLATADALGKGATGETLSPSDMGKIAELRVMRRQLDEATAEGPAGAARAEVLRNEIRQHERQLDIVDDSPDAARRRRMVEAQVVVQNDRARREGARGELDAERGHPGVELHSHFMGVVDTEVFRRKAAEAAHGEDTGSWVPVLEQLVSFRQFEHERGPDRAITKRSTAGDALEIVSTAQRQIALLTKEQGAARSPEAKQAIQERIEMLAQDAARSALTATEHTDFNSAYEMRDELVKATFAGKAPDRADKAATAEYEARAYDEYTREAIRRLARDRVGYTEQSNSTKKLAQRFGADRIRRIVDELIAAGEIKPGEVDVRFLTMIPTRNFGERADGNPEEAHAPRRTDKEGEKAFGDSISTMGEQVRTRGDTVGMDIASLELYAFDGIGRERFKRMYDELRDAARERGQPTVLRPHVGEGAVDNDAGKPFQRDQDRKRTPDGALTHQERARHNLDQFLTALEELRDAGDLDPTLVVVRFGHATMATPEQAARMTALGVIAEVNLGSNVRTGATDQTVAGVDGKPSPVEQFDDHAFPTLLYYDAEIMLSTDGHDVMQTTMRGEYQRALQLIEEVLSGERKVRVRAADADGRGKPDSDGETWLSVEDFTPAELARFTRGYEKLHADAEAYYAHRPRPEQATTRNAPGDASPAGGAHWTDLARQHNLLAVDGQRRFAGSREEVEAAVAAYRRQGATALPVHDGAGSVRYRVTSADGRAILELEGWNDGHAAHLPVADLDDPLGPGTNPEIRQWYKNAVKEIPALDAAWQAQGVALEDRARRAYDIRHHARIQARDLMGRESEVAGLNVRDMTEYGNPDGPTFAQLVEDGMKDGKSRDEALQAIIGSARKTNAEYDRRTQVNGEGGAR